MASITEAGSLSSDIKLNKPRTNYAEWIAAGIFVLPFVVIYAVLFIYPTVQMILLSFQNAPLIGAGTWVGIDNYIRLFKDRLFSVAIWNTVYFVILSVIPSAIFGLIIAMGVNRLKGWAQSVILACFFLPYILPVSVVYRIWNWMFDSQFGILQYPIHFFFGQNVPVFRTLPLFMPSVAFITVWWLMGFNVLLFIAGLRNISPEIYESASLDGANRWQQFTRITWPLIWPVTVLVLTIQMILQFKIFDQIYLFSIGGRGDATLGLVALIYRSAFQKNQGGYGATVAFTLFAIIVVFSVLQYQALRARGQK
jgi:multiple sugar transport system permease protein